MTPNKLYVVLHGHFYQPPREDAWTDEISCQPSAYPEHDWNVRINKQCYAANAASRVIDGNGKIVDIINNYRFLSFNFGPTLIDWLKKKDPYTLNRIIEADKESMERNNGHGNAIAQVYNHIIMPLACEEDKVTQIEWGLKHFERTFGRKSEGLWLAETAVNDRVAEYLIDYGIRYIILAPTQAESIRSFNDPEGEWEDVSNNNIDPSKPYILKEKNGELAVFFYYGDIAAKLSFEHLLQKSDYLRGELLAHNIEDRESYLIHTATDGEVYGHHEPFGDMCLSRVVYENRENEDFVFTNYGNILDIIPMTHEAKLKEGNDGLGTAWSCAHGVDRWRNDCGCSTGAGEGWNQKWREPVRSAFDFLRDRLFDSVKRELGKYVNDIWTARNDYIDVVMADEREDSVNAFLSKHAKGDLMDYDRTFILRMFEALRNEMLMYTSCGWFFADVSGIETVQDMAYAGRILELAEDILPEDTKDRFLDILLKAKSNIEEYQNGKWIYNSFIEQHVFNEERIINQYLTGHLLTREIMEVGRSEKVYYYDILMEDKSHVEKGDWDIHKFNLKMYNSVLSEESRYIAYVFKSGNIIKSYVKMYVDDSLVNYLDKIIEKDDPRRIIKDFHDWFMTSYSLSDIKYEWKQQILSKIFETSLISLHQRMQGVEIKIDEYLKVIDLYRELDVVLSEKDQVALTELVNSFIMNELNKVEQIGVENYDFTALINTIQTAKRANLAIDYIEFRPIIRDTVLCRMYPAIEGKNEIELSRLEKIIDFTNIAGIEFEKYEVQNLLYDTLHKHVSVSETAGSLDGVGVDMLKTMLRVANKFNISVRAFEKCLKRYM